jgi:D-alanyl-D-alanine carboxypeptidase
MRSAFSCALIAALVFGAPAAASAQPSEPAFPAAAVTAAVTAMLAAQKVPSATVEVVQDGTVTYVHAFGLRDLETNAPADIGTHYEIGSMTKQFTAAAILQLQEAGKLHIDDPVSTYLPDAPHAREITLRQLLTQRSGLFDYTDVPQFAEKISTTPGSYAKIVALVAGKPLNFTPGSRWEYSNTNYILLGRIVEVVSGQRYADYIREHEFEPAGMTQTTTIAHESQTPDMARGYTLDHGQVKPSLPLDDGWPWSAGNIVSTVGDYEKWMDALTTGKIVTPADFEEMTTATASNRIDASSAYGFGFVIDRTDGQPNIWHNGGTNGFHTDGAYFPRQATRIAVFTNLDSAFPEAVAAKIFELAFPEIAAAGARPAAGEDLTVTKRLKAFFTDLLAGNVDRGELTDAMSKRLTPQRASAFPAAVKPLGAFTGFIYRGKSVIGSTTEYDYAATFADGTLKASFYIDNATDRIAKLEITM